MGGRRWWQRGLGGLVLAVLVGLAGPAIAAEGPGGDTFTIEKVAMDAAGPRITVTLDRPVAVREITEAVRLFPRVELHAVEGRVEGGKTVLSLSGDLRRGGRYLLSFEDHPYRRAWFSVAVQGLAGAMENGVDPSVAGVRLTRVPAATAAALQGLREGDVVLEVQGRLVLSLDAAALQGLVSPVDLVVARDGERRTLTLRREAAPEGAGEGWLAATFGQLGWQRLGYRVARVDEGGLLARAGLRQGDVILALVVNSSSEPFVPERLSATVEFIDLAVTEAVELRVRRGSKELTLRVPYPEGSLRYAGDERTIVIPDAPPALTWSGAAPVVERRGRQLVALKVTNVATASVAAVTVPPAAVARVAQGLDAGRPAPAAGPEEVRALVARLATETAPAPFPGPVEISRDAFPTAGPRNQAHAESIPLTFRDHPEQGAVLLVQARGVEGGTTPWRLVRVTDLGITSKRWEGGLLVWVTSLATGRPVAGAAVGAAGEDGVLHPLGRTGEDGVLLVRSASGEGAGLDLAHIDCLVATTEEDVAYLRVGGGEGGVAVPGGEEERPTVRCRIFTERGVYRPQEVVHLKGLVRTFAGGRVAVPGAESPASTARVVVKGPKGREATVWSGRLSRFGSLAATWSPPAGTPLGTYTLRLSAGEAEGTATFQIQEYRPPRHYVELAFARESRHDPTIVGRDDEVALVRIEVAGRYYAGGPVKNGRVRWQVYLVGTSHTVEGVQGYTFGNPDPPERDLLESGETLLDAAGRAVVRFPLDTAILLGNRGLEVVASVVDFDGRVSTHTRRFQVAQDYLVGIGDHPEKVDAGAIPRLRVAVFDRQGHRLARGRVHAEVQRQDTTYVRKVNDQGEVTWEFRRVWRSLSATDVDLTDGEGTLLLDHLWWGRYRIAVTYRDAEGHPFTSATELRVRGGYWSYDYEHRYDPYEPLNVWAERAELQPGETAVLHLRPRREVGAYLLAVEQAGLLQYRVALPSADKERVRLEAAGAWAPNVHVTVLATTPRGDLPLYPSEADEAAPAFLYGGVDLRVSPVASRLAVALGGSSPAALRGRPGEEFTLPVVVTGAGGRGVEAEVAVAVVDERVLALTRYATPDLADLARFDLPDRVVTRELRRLLVGQTPLGRVVNRMLTGGGGAKGAGTAASAAISGRIRKDFRPVAFFDPALVTGADGRAVVRFTLPDTMTTYRCFAVACDTGGRFASTARPLLAVKPFYLEPGLPRFLNAGDRFRFRVAAFNQTQEAGRAALSVSASGAVHLALESGALELPAGGRSEAVVAGEAMAVGEATATFGGRLGRERDALEVHLPVHSGHTRVVESHPGIAKGRTRVRVNLDEAARTLPWGEVEPGEVEVRLRLSRSLQLHLRATAAYLLHYPYGCIEQTSSATFALAALRGAVAAGAIPGVTGEEVDHFLRAGVARILSMQVEGGGFAYWPGERSASPRGSLYAVQALLAARDAGMSFPEEALSGALGYVGRAVEKGDVDSAFAAYLLARGGKLPVAERLAAAAGLQSGGMETRLFRLLALEAAGGTDRQVLVTAARSLLDELLPRALLSRHRSWWQRLVVRLRGGDDGEGGATVGGGGDDPFNPRYRARALTLLVADALLPESAYPKAAADHLLVARGLDGVWTATSDTGWALFALAHYLAGTKEQESAHCIVEGAGVRQEVALAGDRPAVVELDARRFFADPTLTLRPRGGVPLVYEVEVAYPLVAGAHEEHGHGLRVHKEIHNLDGSDRVRVGDVVRVEVEVEVNGASWERPYRYVVLDDPLPAGLVAINSALATEERPPASEEEAHYRYWLDDGLYAWIPDHLELRDDRVLAFRDEVWWNGTYRYTYYARAVCAGTFVVPATKVALMYDREVVGYSPVGRFVVEAR